MNIYPTVRLIEGDDRAAVVAAMGADGHHWMGHSHLVERNGEIIGAAALGSVPLVVVWHARGRVQVRDAMHLKLVYDSIMETRGAGQYLIGCDKESPYAHLMGKGGFKPVWETQLFLGGVKA